MASNLDKFKIDLDDLIKEGSTLYTSLVLELHPNDEKVKKEVEKTKIETVDFNLSYEAWYSESLAVIKQILPDRLMDFVLLYKNEKRKKCSYETYTVSDKLMNLQVSYGMEVLVDKKAVLPKFQQQLTILIAAKKRFQSSLFDINQILYADMFDSEIDSANELLKHKFIRPAGVLAGVVLEKHLSQVVKNHGLSVSKKDPAIGDYNELLKAQNAIDVPTWRFIQRLGDLRNLSGHDKGVEPTGNDIREMIDGVIKVLKTVI